MPQARVRNTTHPPGPIKCRARFYAHEYSS